MRASTVLPLSAQQIFVLQKVDTTSMSCNKKILFCVGSTAHATNCMKMLPVLLSF